MISHKKRGQTITHHQAYFHHDLWDDRSSNGLTINHRTISGPWLPVRKLLKHQRAFLVQLYNLWFCRVLLPQFLALLDFWRQKLRWTWKSRLWVPLRGTHVRPVRPRNLGQLVCMATKFSADIQSSMQIHQLILGEPRIVEHVQVQ